MDFSFLSIIILDAVLLISGIFMSAKKFDKKHSDIVWKLVEYVTMALVGYQLGTGRII